MTPDFPQLVRTLAPMRCRNPKPALDCLRQATLCQVEERLAKFLPAQHLRQNESQAHSRRRLLPLNRTFWCWLWQILQCNTSCREVLRQVQMLFCLHGLSIDEGTSAYCQARGKIPLDLLTGCIGRLAQTAFALVPHSPLLQGRRLKAVDGSSARLADTRENQRAFPQSASQKPGAGFPVMKIVALLCVATGSILTHITGNQSQSELSLAWQLAASLVKGEVLIADRGFCNYSLLALLRGQGVDLIARVPTTIRKIDFRQGKKLGHQDALFGWKKSSKPCSWLPLAQWLGLPDTLTVRVIRVRLQLPGIRVQTLTLATTLLDPDRYPVREIIQAYGLRWRQEMCFDDLKTTLEMAHLKSKTPEMARKELGMFLIAHNFLRCVMAEAAAQARIEVKKISFKGTLDGFRQCANAMAQTSSKAKRTALWMEFKKTLAADLVPARPGRLEPRAVKRIFKYPKLITHRKRYKDRMSRNKRRRQATRRRNAAN